MKRNIKSRKIDKGKGKMLVSKCTITLLMPTIVEPPASLAISETLAITAVMLLLSFALRLVVFAPLVSLPLSYSSSNFYPTLLPYHTTVLSNLVGVPTL